MKQKLYCYVDETGQDTKGDMFIVSVIVTGKERDALLQTCQDIEMESGKNKDKWGRSKPARRLDYIQRILSNKLFKKKLRFSVYRSQVNYDLATINAIAKALYLKKPPEGYSALIYIDGLKKTKRQKYGSELRKLGVSTKKVQGVNKDENNSLIRLADAEETTVQIFKEAIKSGGLIEL